MSRTRYWADTYLEKQRTAESAVKTIKSGQRVFIGSACGEPQALVTALAQASLRLADLEIVRMMSHESASLSSIASQARHDRLNVRQIYLGSSGAEKIAQKKRFITPMNMSEVPALFKSRKMPIHVALIQVSPPDDLGWMSFGVSVDVTMAAAFSAEMVIAQINPHMPRVLGQSFIHLNDVDLIVEHEEPLLSVTPGEPSEVSTLIGTHIARLIEDGATLQIGLDAASQATLQALAQKNDLGLHSQYLTDDVMRLFAMGVINNRQKGFNEGKLVASAAVGTENLYEFIDDNPGVEFQPSDVVNNPHIISLHHRMVSLNVAKAIDLTGQATAEAAAQTFFAGVSGIPDFVRGAKRAPGGKSILMLPSTDPQGGSNILAVLTQDVVVVPRGDIHYVATEYGVVNLHGKSLQERAMALISIAHPNFRQTLFDSAKEAGLIGPDRTLGEAVFGIYPVRLEETVQVGNQTVFIRPAKPVDQRRLQEHYYNLDKEDVTLRFFHEKHIFARDEIEHKSQIDYIQSLTLIGVVGEVGYGKVVAVGEYMLLLDSNVAEVAFSIDKAYQGKGLGRILLRKLAQAARENGISGLVAYTTHHNRPMIKLFKSLPYQVKTFFDGETLSMRCNFDELT